MPVNYSREGAIARIEISRPDVLNALDRAMYRELNSAFSSFNEDEKARVAILTSACEAAFCAGVDIKDLHHGMTVEGYSLPELREQFTLFFETPGAITKPVVAAIHGHCVGEGLVMTLFCDLRICSSDAEFSLPEAKVGLPSIDGTVRAVQLIGHAAAMELLLTGETRDASWAGSVGLVNQVVDRDDLLEQATQRAESIASIDPAACAIMREIGERALDEPFDQVVAHGTRLRDAMSKDAMIERQRRFSRRRRD